ncbi:MAG: cytochrome c [Acidobacteriia bacterium]|nr:cytochrome c [Terriglobia bacterium]
MSLSTVKTTLATALVLAAVAFGVSRVRIQAQPRLVPGAPSEATRGKVVYDAHCVECHGASGRGDGPAAMTLTPRPRDFSSGKFKIRSTETGSVPTDDDLIRSVSQGLAGSAMPAWRRILPDADIAAVVQYVKSLSPQFAQPPVPVKLGADVASSPPSIARGTGVYEKLQCGKCHGSDGRGTGAATTTFEDDWRQPLNAADLTEPWTFHGGATSRDIFLRFRTGMMGTPMPSFKDAATDAEMWDLANFVVSLARTPLWTMTAEEVAAFYKQKDADARANPVKRGRYLVDTFGCGLCHSPVDQDRRVLPGMYMAGGLRVRVEPFGDYPTGNLTSDKETGLGNWTDDEIRQAITRGILKDGIRLPPYPMDWSAYSAMNADDLSAMVAYLRSLPPVKNKVPRPSRPFLPMYLWGKFKMLILQQDPPLLFFPGNAGTAGGRS